MITYLIYVLAVSILLDAMDLNNFHGWLKDKGAFFTNNWKVKYKEDGKLKWWVYLGGAAWIDFWHVTKSVLLLVVFTYPAVLSGLPWWMGFVGWCIFGFVHENVFYRRFK